MSLHDDEVLVRAAGFNPDRMQPVELYLLAGKIIQDRPLFGLVVARQKRSPAIPQMPAFIPADACEQVLRDMTPRDRQLLRERVTGVKEFPSRRSS